MHNIYLAGPVTGLSFDRAASWRYDFVRYFRAISGRLDAVFRNPLRGKEDVLNGVDRMEDVYAHPLMTEHAIMESSYQDVINSDYVVANFLGAEKVSIGTVMEIGWAFDNRVPVILIMEKEGNVHDHSMIRMACAYRAESVMEAAKLLGHLLPS